MVSACARPSLALLAPPATVARPQRSTSRRRATTPAAPLKQQQHHHHLPSLLRGKRKGVRCEAGDISGRGEGVGAEGDSSGQKKQQPDYSGKIAEKLAAAAAAQAARQREAERLFALGERAYAKGEYEQSVEALEAASNFTTLKSDLGGQVALWRAMALEACKRNSECIALLKEVEKKHPDEEVKKQAANLKFIYEAPKLRLEKEDFVSIPTMNLDPKGAKKTWRNVKPWRPSNTAPEPTLEEFLAQNNIPRWAGNMYAWVALSVTLTAVGLWLKKFYY
eukprot:jgi/Chlat1/3475/Chrsp23S03669